MSESKLSMRELIENRIETTVSNSTIPDGFKAVKRYKFPANTYAETIEELEYIAYVLYQNFDVSSLIRKSGAPDWAQKQITFDAIALPKQVHHVQSVAQISMGIMLDNSVVHVIVNYKFVTEKDLTFTSQLELG